MPTPTIIIALQPLGEADLKRITGVQAPKTFRSDFPKRAPRVPVHTALRNWQRSVAPPPDVKNPEVRIKAVEPTRAALTKLRNVIDAGLAPAAMEKQAMGPDKLFGTLFSALATHEFMRLEADYRRRKGRGGPAAARTELEWQRHVRDFSRAFAAAGLPNVGEAELRQYAKDLNANKANRDWVIAIASSGRDALEMSFTAAFSPRASFVPTTGVFFDPTVVITPIPDLCDKPISEGAFTKHFSDEIALSVRISYPCGISWSGIKWCKKTVTLASVSFSVAVNVGYKVTCCGATVWGQAGAQVCASIVGIRVCAQCTATIVGVAGVARTPVADGCKYGLGINATLRCTLAGATILNVAYPFGWTVTGPCPPAGMCP